MKRSYHMLTIVFMLLFTHSFAQNHTFHTIKPTQDIQRFATAIAQIQKHYVTSVDFKTLFDHAIRGMVTNLDPHSDYLSSEDFAQLQDSVDGSYGGIGIEVTFDQGMIKVISPFDQTPAALAGIQAGDTIIKINQKLVKSIGTDKAISMIRGKKGSFVVLTIVRKGLEKPFDLSIQREEIAIKATRFKRLSNNIGYVRIALFNEKTAEEIAQAINTLNQKKPISGLVLDVRNNPGGLLKSAVDTCDLFLNPKKIGHNKLIVFTKGREPSNDIHAYATGHDMLKGKPIAVLVNQGSASASEIVAGALQDHQRAIVIGNNSFGKGSVQALLPIGDHAAIKLTTSLYYTPAGRSIQATGIVPDVYTPFDRMPQEIENPEKDKLLHESMMQGHLSSGQSHDEHHQLHTKFQQRFDLAKKDFQLFQAVNLLSGLQAVAK